MSRQFLTNIDLNKNQLLNAVIQTLSVAPANPVIGQIYYNTDDKTMYQYDGTSWLAVGSVTSVDGTANQVAVSTTTGDVVVSLTDEVTIFDGLVIGGSVNSVNGYITLKNTTGTPSASVGVNGTTLNISSTNGDVVLFADNDVVLKGRISLTDATDTETAFIEHSYTGTTRLTAGDDLALRSTGGDIILYPGNDDGGTGKAYVHWGNDATGSAPENEITTAGNIQSLSNKNIKDQVIFENSTTVTQDGVIAVNATTNDFEITAYTADLKIATTTSNTNVVVEPNGGKFYYGSKNDAGNEVATVADLQASTSGLNWKQAVNLKVSTNTPIFGDFVGRVFDGHPALTLADAGYRLLLTGQSTDSENGIYELADDGGNLVAQRPADADVYSELLGAAVFVMEGTTYGATSWVQTNHYLSAFSGQTWTQFSGQGTYIGSDSILIDGNEISVIADGTRGAGSDVDGIYVKTGDGVQIDGSGNVAAKLGTGLAINGSGAISFDTGYGVRKHTAQNTELTPVSGTVTWTVTHSFGTRDTTVQVYELDTYTQVEVDVVRHENNVELSWVSGSVINADSYRVVVIG